MTHSGQGDERRPPAARPAHEGVVLPADGSEPLIPGTPGAQPAPAGGQPWGAPWGPQEPPPQPPQAAPGYGYPGPPPAQAGGGQAAQGYGYPAAPAQAGGYGYPAAPAQAGGYGYPAPPPAQADGYGYPAQPAPYGAQPQQQPAPGGYAPPPPQPGPQSPHAAHGNAPQDGYGYGAPQGAAPQGQFTPPGALPPQDGYPQYGAAPQGQYPTHGAPAAGPQLPQGNAHPGAAPMGDADAPQGQYPTHGAPAAGPQLPQGNAHPGAAPMGDADATQYIAPVGPGALPPEMPAESTTFLGRVDAGGPQDGQSPQSAPQGPDADATQYIAPVPPAPPGASFGVRPGAPEDRRPPAEFDSLFRSEGHDGAEPADATQQMPRFEEPPSPRYQQPGRYEPPYDPEPEPRRRSTAPVVAALVIGCAVLGIGVGAVMFGDDDKDPDPAPDKIVAAESPTPSAASPSAEEEDPAEPQAKELDRLLADSSSSRDAVVRSVQNIRACKNLDRATADLKDAAQQRRDLVTRLNALSVDKLPDNAALTASLTEAWQASASADDHYAAWAQQVKGKKGCKDGKARDTKQTAMGNQASSEATTAKNQASKLWNAIARKYELTERSSRQL